MEFLITKLGKGEFSLGFHIEREIRTCGPYPWNEDTKPHRWSDWYIRLGLLFVEITLGSYHKII